VQLKDEECQYVFFQDPAAGHTAKASMNDALRVDHDQYAPLTSTHVTFLWGTTKRKVYRSTPHN
jgi:hypothetical protein